jgi:hypothetical protein
MICLYSGVQDPPIFDIKIPLFSCPIGMSPPGKAVNVLSLAPHELFAIPGSILDSERHGQHIAGLP